MRTAWAGGKNKGTEEYRAATEKFRAELENQRKIVDDYAGQWPDSTEVKALQAKILEQQKKFPAPKPVEVIAPPAPVVSQADSYKGIKCFFEASKRNMNTVKNTDPEYATVRNNYVDDLRAQSKELDNHLAMYPDDASAIKLKKTVDEQVVKWTPKKAATPVAAPKPVPGVV